MITSMQHKRRERIRGGRETIGEEKTTFSFPFLQFVPLINGATKRLDHSFILRTGHAFPLPPNNRNGWMIQPLSSSNHSLNFEITQFPFAFLEFSFRDFPLLSWITRSLCNGKQNGESVGKSPLTLFLISFYITYESESELVPITRMRVE